MTEIRVLLVDDEPDLRASTAQLEPLPTPAPT